MNRTEFMERLEELLSDVPQEERRDALRYYNDYLDDAGAENENAALAALVSPENVADSIRAGLQEEEASGSGRNAVGRPVSGQERNAVGRPVSGQGRNAAGRQATGPERPGRKGEAGRIILTVLACIFLLPVLIPLGLGAVILAFSFLVCAAVFFASMILSGIVVLVIGVALSLFALVNLAAFPSSAVCILGGGMVCVGIGLLLTLFMCWLAGKTIPAMCRGFVSLCSLPFHRNKGGRQEERPLS
ncbi:MAG TPA: hypothetical protein H9912_08525 [Candidatus Eisenbergiella stercorigallinarum]|uniref:DUF1700 domain-containing protein n=1 Tax=Candidatus Eisenbergiella stercorigallinarum TaxID=2838557 RepID=A0A9D2R0U2_9FIRM|nr:hypothetical protein [Candidatus Eisenbergiella stercorigallinarum]